jgi:gallate decarboxylase subunit D
LPVEFNVATDEGEFDLEAKVLRIGDDLLVAIWGGEQPHIGALAMSQPRPSISDENITSSTTSVFTFLGHKEDELAKSIAGRLSASLEEKVVVTAGIHWDHISVEGIQKVLKNSQILMDLILERLHFSTKISKT